MAAIKGKDGVVSIAAQPVAQVKSYSITESTETAETTVMGNNSKTHVPTIKSWEGSVDVVYNSQEFTDTDLLPGGAEVALILYPAGTGNNYNGSIIVTSMEVTGETADVVSATINFTGTGDLARSN